MNGRTDQRFSARDDFTTLLPRRHLTTLETFSIIIAWEVLLAVSAESPEILLDILLCSGEPLQYRIIWSKASAAWRLRKSRLGDRRSLPTLELNEGP